MSLRVRKTPIRTPQANAYCQRFMLGASVSTGSFDVPTEFCIN